MSGNRSELLPCPFCGGEAELRDPHIPFSRLAAVYCNECEIRGPLESMPDRAIAEWNTRAPNQPLSDSVVERVEAMLWQIKVHDGNGAFAAHLSADSVKETAKAIIAAIPSAGGVETEEGLGASPGSRPSDQAPTGLGGSRFDPARVEQLERALRPFAAAAQLFTSGVHNGGLENVQAFPTAQEWRIAASLFPELRTTAFPKNEALRDGLAGQTEPLCTHDHPCPKCGKVFSSESERPNFCPYGCGAISGEAGYVEAFYELADMMGIGAQPRSPKDVWEQQMKPRLAPLFSDHSQGASVTAGVFSLLLHAEQCALAALEDFHVDAIALQQARIAELRDVHSRAALGGGQ
jgi:Lar family restriction alleviation protein